jgi:hypothetical protein
MVQLSDVVSFSRELTLVRCTVSDLEWNARSSRWQPDHDVRAVLKTVSQPVACCVLRVGPAADCALCKEGGALSRMFHAAI